MRVSHAFLAAVAVLAFLLPSAAQQSSPSPSPQSVTAPQAAQYLQLALAALGARSPVTDVALSGTAHRIAGSDDESGTAVLKALASGASRVDLSLSSGQRSEILNTFAQPPTGRWSGPDGVAHAIALHNLLTDPAWFFPAFPIAHGLSANYLATYVGAETHNGEAVQHISISQPPPVPDPPGISWSHLTQIDLFLDATSLLPAALDFNIHPDSNALLDIPIEVRFSDYRSVNGVKIAFHVEKYLNNGLVLDIQAQSANLNTGLSPNDFAIEAPATGVAQ